jgi:hypothetical protein
MEYSYLLAQLPSNTNQYDFWRDPIWQLVIGLLAIGATFFVFFKQLQRKSLIYKIDSSIILEVANEFRADLKIIFKGRSIDSLTLVSVKFSNNGNTSIEKKDYDRSLTVDFGDKAEVLSFNITEQSPDNLDVVLKSGNNKAIEIEALLLNQKDYFVLQALVSQYSSTIVNGRISGVRSIKEIIENKSQMEYVDKALSDMGYMIAGGGILFLAALFSTVTKSIFPITFTLIASYGFVVINRFSEYYFKHKKQEIRNTKRDKS